MWSDRIYYLRPMYSDTRFQTDQRKDGNDTGMADVISALGRFCGTFARKHALLTNSFKSHHKTHYFILPHSLGHSTIRTLYNIIIFILKLAYNLLLFTISDFKIYYFLCIYLFNFYIYLCLLIFHLLC